VLDLEAGQQAACSSPDGKVPLRRFKPTTRDVITALGGLVSDLASDPQLRIGLDLLNLALAVYRPAAGDAPPTARHAAPAAAVRVPGPGAVPAPGAAPGPGAPAPGDASAADHLLRYFRQVVERFELDFPEAAAAPPGQGWAAWPPPPKDWPPQPPGWPPPPGGRLAPGAGRPPLPAEWRPRPDVVDLRTTGLARPGPTRPGPAPPGPAEGSPGGGA